MAPGGRAWETAREPESLEPHPGLDALFNFPALTFCMKWLWLNGAGFALATAYYGQGVSGLERLTLFTSALVALWIFDWR